MAANPSIVQSNASASSAAAPATYTHNFGQASTAGTLLVALVAYAESGAASLSPPAGWTQTSIGSNGGNTIGGRLLYMANNPGGVTSVALTALVGINGIAVAFFEFANMALVLPVDPSFPPAQTIVNSNAAPGGPVDAAADYGNIVYIGCEFDVTGQAYTPNNTPAATGLPQWQTGPTATSTVGATNVVIRAFYAILGPQPNTGPIKIQGTLAGALANGVIIGSFLSQNAAALVGAGTGTPVDMLTGQAISVGSA